ncbi:MAG: aminotransferase class I/II-fold pyridoxal phosphate-dependent enzyme [Candidatus Binatia bacterium]|nr:aminotransferase class I/II-fold pyridoxal phosphate-dependent enzyme [Candidatus Binatia bacterium]
MSAPTKSTEPTEPILLSPPHLSGEEIQLVTKAIESNWIAPVGPDLDAFEAELAAKVGVSAAAGVSSGTAALHLALQILGVGSGDEVLCSTFTFAASANPILYCGATPVFIDSSPDTWNMDPALLDQELRAMAARGCLPKAAIVVDLYGQCADYDPILTSCAEFDVPVISDAAEALGASYGDTKAGSLGDIAIVSFNGNKILTCSGGGALLSDNPEYAERARFLATQARDPAPHYEHTTVGYNYRLSNLLAAIGRGQLRVLEDRVAARRAIRELYKKELAGVSGITFAPEADYGQSNGWLTCILVDEQVFGASREDIREHLGSLQIESRPLWKPMHEQPVFAKYRAVGGDISSRLFRDGLCLPSGSALPEDSVARIASEIAGVGK